MADQPVFTTLGATMAADGSASHPFVSGRIIAAPRWISVSCALDSALWQLKTAITSKHALCIIQHGQHDLYNECQQLLDLILPNAAVAPLLTKKAVVQRTLLDAKTAQQYDECVKLLKLDWHAIGERDVTEKKNEIYDALLAIKIARNSNDTGRMLSLSILLEAIASRLPEFAYKVKLFTDCPICNEYSFRDQTPSICIRHNSAIQSMTDGMSKDQIPFELLIQKSFQARCNKKRPCHFCTSQSEVPGSTLNKTQLKKGLRSTPFHPLGLPERLLVQAPWRAELVENPTVTIDAIGPGDQLFRYTYRIMSVSRLYSDHYRSELWYYTADGVHFREALHYDGTIGELFKKTRADLTSKKEIYGDGVECYFILRKVGQGLSPE